MPRRQSTVHSHAARVIHARRRRSRILSYQSARGRGVGQMPSELPTWPAREGLLTRSQDSIGASPTAIVDTYRRGDPFNSFVRPLSPTEHLLLDHYLAHIVPLIDAGCSRISALGSAQRQNLTVGWVNVALSNLDFLNGLFLNASRSLSVRHVQEQQREQYAELAIRYKLLCVRFVIDSIRVNNEVSRLGDIPVAETLVLAFDEKLMGNADMAKQHVEGAVRMVELQGGPRTLGMNGLLAMMLAKYTEDVGLSTATAT
ncbi:hypothetical protein QBC34DRAFT_311750 [Podospora aff. communis PSN243]|uniref:Uncharacterized protein n=1 Tax=Podospora aff. communis PSN243 TaxID=3040156 RepID=A0AAV9G5E0_9PEZI|nr:hypothetical protein QBC34DRAFT_311750 [Podospora aff. communis PSN243]